MFGVGFNGVCELSHKLFHHALLIGFFFDGGIGGNGLEQDEGVLAPSDSMGYDGLNGAVALTGKEGGTGSEVGGSIEKGDLACRAWTSLHRGEVQIIDVV